MNNEQLESVLPILANVKMLIQSDWWYMPENES